MVSSICSGYWGVGRDPHETNSCPSPLGRSGPSKVPNGAKCRAGKEKENNKEEKVHRPRHLNAWNC